MYRQKKSPNRAMTVNAHRGYSSAYPENTLLAFTKAIELGADYIELDVRESKDGVLIISHDASLDRRGRDKRKVSDLTADQLRQVDVGMGQYIPTLAEVLTLCKDKIGIHLEIKEFGLAKEIVELIRSHKMLDQIIFSSFQHVELFQIRKHYPEAITAIVVPSGNLETRGHARAYETIFAQAEMVNAQGIHINQSWVDDDFLGLAHDRGYYVNAWNVDAPIMWEAFLEMGMDGIFTNDAARLITFLEKQ
jgi:glycerophosphoryl diester phosphodiesterase